MRSIYLQKSVFDLQLKQLVLLDEGRAMVARGRRMVLLAYQPRGLRRERVCQLLLVRQDVRQAS